MSEKFNKDDVLKVEDGAFGKKAKTGRDIFKLADFEYSYYAYGYMGKLFYNGSGCSQGIAALNYGRTETASAGVTMDGTVVYTVAMDKDQGADGEDHQVIVPFINDIEDLVDNHGEPIPLGAHIAIEDFEEYVWKQGCFVFRNFSEVEELAERLGLDEYYAQ